MEISVLAERYAAAMQLAEALIERADLQKRAAQLQQRLRLNAKRVTTEHIGRRLVVS